MKSRKPRLLSRHAAHSPAIPPPTIASGTFSSRTGWRKGWRSRRRWPMGKLSLTNDPSIGRSAFAVKPTRAALRKPRRFTLLLLSRNIAPFLLVVAHQHLVVEPVRLGRNLPHVVRKFEHLRNVISRQKSQAGGHGDRRLVRSKTREHESPFTERRNINVIGICQQAGALESLLDAPVRLTREQRGCALDDQKSSAVEMPCHQPVERGGVELTERLAGRVREVDHHEIEWVRIRCEPRERVGVDDVHARSG